MGTATYRYPGTNTSETQAGSNSGTWSTPDNVASDDLNSSTMNIGKGYSYSDWLRCVNFGFDVDGVPEQANIVGIRLAIKKDIWYSGPADYIIKLRTSSGQVGSNKAKSAQWPYPITQIFYGGTTDMWGTSLTAADVRSSEFGVDISVENNNTDSNRAAHIYDLQMQIYYVLPAIVTTQAVTEVSSATGLGNGNITRTGESTVTRRGFCYVAGTSGDPTVADGVAYDDGSFEMGAYEKEITGLSGGTSYRVRAYVVNTEGVGYGNTVQMKTGPDAPTNTAATDGTHIDKVVITWTKSVDAVGYQVYRDGNALGWLGDVATYDDDGADASVIAPGTATATDGSFIDKVVLGVSSEIVSNGTTHTYKVKARNVEGSVSLDSATDTGYRGHGALAYQWQRSALDTDEDFSDITGATTEDYDDTEAPT